MIKIHSCENCIKYNECEIKHDSDFCSNFDCGVTLCQYCNNFKRAVNVENYDCTDFCIASNKPIHAKDEPKECILFDQRNLTTNDLHVLYARGLFHKKSNKLDINSFLENLMQDILQSKNNEGKHEGNLEVTCDTKGASIKWNKKLKRKEVLNFVKRSISALKHLKRDLKDGKKE